MSKSKKLTKRQRAVLEDLFTGESDEQTVLQRYAVPRALYEKWLADEQFTSQLEQRIAHAYQRSRIILARNASDAANRLVNLAKEGEGETARKACLDVISPQCPAGHKTPSDAPSVPDASASAADLSPEAASRLLAVLAAEA